MQGTYKISSKHGVFVAKNIITDAGRASILNAISGKSTGFASSLVAGIGTTAATTADVELQYAVGGNDINAIITDLVNEKIYYKATLPANDNYSIYELGCFSTNFTAAQNSNGAGNIALVAFGSSTGWLDIVGTSAISSVNNRVGVDSIQYTSFSSAKGYMLFNYDLSSLALNATFDLAYYTNAVTDLIVRFKFDDDNYFEANTWSVSNGYNISKIPVSAFTATGVPSWNDLRILEIEATGTAATLSLDSLRYTIPVVSEAIDSSLLSRVVLTTPQQKLAGVSMDVEYMLELNI
jgi:hypothetical protein